MLALVLTWVWAGAVPSVTRAATTWSKNVFVAAAMVYQDPYPNACTAATAMTILNTIAYRRAGGSAFRWKPYTVKDSPNPDNVRDMLSIFAFARAHDTLSLKGKGSDSHGWRNAINHYGWGDAVMLDPARRVYETLAYRSYDAAVHAAVRAIARFGMPVGIAGMAGQHAQVLTGYVVDGADPAISDAFTVRYVYLTDPLKLRDHVNQRISNARLKDGPFGIRFASYRETDSPKDDPYAAGWHRSSVSPTVGASQWYRRWVIVAPIRSPSGTTPTPTPTPTPPPTEPPDATPTPARDPTDAPTASPTAPATEPSPLA